MAKSKRFYYLVDNLTQQRADVIVKGLKAVDSIEAVRVDMSQGIVEVVASRKPDDNMEAACEVAGTVLRTKIKKKQLH